MGCCCRWAPLARRDVRAGGGRRRDGAVGVRRGALGGPDAQAGREVRVLRPGGAGAGRTRRVHPASGSSSGSSDGNRGGGGTGGGGVGGGGSSRAGGDAPEPEPQLGEIRQRAGAPLDGDEGPRRSGLGRIEVGKVDRERRQEPRSCTLATGRLVV